MPEELEVKRRESLAKRRRERRESKLPEELRTQRSKSAEMRRRRRRKMKESKLPEELKIKTSTPADKNKT